ncbi:hypothetical protein J6590_037718 [Homalodisca vitripennis]|nr:hypothetical protein J6590_037718 [Homalodisca vitripennis]
MPMVSKTCLKRILASKAFIAWANSWHTTGRPMISENDNNLVLKREIIGERMEAEWMLLCMLDWMCKVTFNGPPPEDSDNIPNMVQMPWFQQSRPNQPYRTNGGAPGRMQDFMMFNIANGNTNHSFSTLRFLERYDHVSSLQKGPEIPDYLFQENKKSKSKKKKKSKTTNHDMFSHVPQQNHSRKHY